MLLAASGHLDLVLLGVIAGAACLLIAAYRSGLPFPILLVVGGAAMGLLPSVDSVSLEPDLVLVIFLPPLLYAAAFFGSLKDLRDNIGQISLLAIGLVVATTLAVGAVTHELIPDLSWPAAFTLGAILSPTDPVAATEIASRVRAPRRFVTIVEGESLVNDASGLIVYKFALAAAVSGTFSMLDAAGEFVVDATLGVAIGISVGFVISAIRARIDDAPTEITISVFTPYFAYLPAEALGVSAVLAAVTSGIWLGWRSPHLITPETRIQAFAFWEIMVFGLNAALFVLVGLQLPIILDAVAADYSTAQLAGYGGLCAATVIAVRFAWVWPAAYLSRLLPARLRGGRARQPAAETLLVAFTGMRGAVGLAAALAIPPSVPERDLIVFLTYAVILVTVVGQGLALPALIRGLRVADDGLAERERESEARLRAAHAALKRLDELADEDWVRDASHSRLYQSYEFRIRRFTARLDGGPDDDGIEEGSLAYQRMRREVLEAERAEIIRLRNQGAITDAIMRRIERDLDLEDARLEI